MRFKKNGRFIARLFPAAIGKRCQLLDRSFLRSGKTRLFALNVFHDAFSNGIVLTLEEIERSLDDALGYALALK